MFVVRRYVEELNQRYVLATLLLTLSSLVPAYAIDAEDLDGSNGFVIRNTELPPATGAAGVGDINADGFDDVMTRDILGGCYVIHGGQGEETGSVFVEDLDGSNGFHIDDVNFRCTTYGAAGDLNDDGFADIIWANGQGGVFVVFGGQGAGENGTFESADLDGEKGLLLRGARGRTVHAAGDVNADGIADVLIEAGNTNPDGTFRLVFVLFGKSDLGLHGGVAADGVVSLQLADLDGTDGFRIDSSNFNLGLLGFGLTGGIDVNNDGADDIVLGVPDATPNGDLSGASYVVFGGANVGAGGRVLVDEPNGVGSFVINGPEPEQGVGYRLGGGDVNADGIDDIFIVGRYVDPFSGIESFNTYVIFGNENIGDSGTLELRMLNGQNGFHIDGGSASIDGVGDVNGDGNDDFLVGGTVTFGDPDIGGSGVLTHAEGFFVAGLRHSGAGDVNGDGLADIIAGDRALSFVVFGFGDELPRPAVFAAAADRNASESFANRGAFRLSRYTELERDLTVRYSLAGTATNGEDYALLAESAVIPAGETSVTIVVDPIHDGAVEGDETVVLTLSSSVTYEIARGSAVVTIKDVDSEVVVPLVYAAAADRNAAEAGAERGVFSLSRYIGFADDVTVRYTLSGTAINGTDYEQLSGTVTIPAGQTSARVVLTPIDDALIEGAETVVLTIQSDPAYDIADASATIRIADDDAVSAGPKVFVAAADRNASEASANTGTFRFSRYADVDRLDLIVTYAVSGDATNGVDYASLSGRVTIPAGQTSFLLVLNPADDLLAEGPETVTLTITPGAYEIARPSATVTIMDDD